MKLKYIFFVLKILGRVQGKQAIFNFRSATCFYTRNKGPFCFPQYERGWYFLREMIEYLPLDRVPQMNNGELVARVQIWFGFCTAICFDRLPFKCAQFTKINKGMGENLKKIKVKLNRQLQHKRTGKLDGDNLFNVNLIASVIFFSTQNLKICLEPLV